MNSLKLLWVVVAGLGLLLALNFVNLLAQPGFAGDNIAGVALIAVGIYGFFKSGRGR